MIVREALALAVAELEAAAVESPRLEAQVLLCFVLGCSTARLLAQLPEPIQPACLDRFREVVGKRVKRIPLQYLTGRQEFMSLSFIVTPEVLIPRADTEVLVEEALKLIKRHRLSECADVGTGSGAIACSLAYYGAAKVRAVDVSPQALAVAARNAEQLGVAEQVSFQEGELLMPLPDAGLKLDLIAANLPYISEAEMLALDPEVMAEPRLALAGGEDGLDYYRRLLPQAALALKDGGYLLMEMGWKQGAALVELTAAHGFLEPVVLQDYAGRDRVVKARFGGA